ncbi:MAG: branched-chain amino acid ABC transporter permease [Anaerolineae bacterium]|nr:branched-chain amino acid ABC transporter permease [Anaerolineae bacterium]
MTGIFKRFFGHWKWIAGAVVVFAVVQVMISTGLLTTYWATILQRACIMAIVSLGLNLIYGFNGQFSLGQWGFYAVGAYAAADITYRWKENDMSGLAVVLATFLLGLILVAWRQRGVIQYVSLGVLGATVVGWVVYLVFNGDANPWTYLKTISGALTALPDGLEGQIALLLALFFGGTLAAIVSYIFGLPVLKMGGDYFGIATLGFTMVVKVLADNADSVFPEMKGARGMVGTPQLASWFWCFSFLALTVIVLRNLLDSTTGRAIVSVREDEIAAKAMGIDTVRYKTLAFVIGSFFAGLAGALYAHRYPTLHPTAFHFVKSFDPLIIVVFGGLGSVSGTVIAAFAWAISLEGLRLLPTGMELWRYVIYPVILLLVMLLRPRGLLGGVEIGFIKSKIWPRREQNVRVEH